MGLNFIRAPLLVSVGALSFLQVLVPSEPRAEKIPAASQRLTSISLALRHEIPLEHPLQLPQDYPWLLERGIVMHPDGKRIAMLLPTEKPIKLQARPASGVSERSFLLAWVGLDTGEVSTSREVSFAENSGFGFSSSEAGDLFCMIGNNKVMILDEAFRTVDWTHAEVSGPQGEKRIATGCAFVPGASKVLVEYLQYGYPGDVQSTLMEWDWEKSSAFLLHWNEYVLDAAPLSENRLITLRQPRSPLPTSLLRFRLEERELRGEKILWGYDVKGFTTGKLFLSRNLLFRVDRDAAWPGEIPPQTMNFRIDDIVLEHEVRDPRRSGRRFLNLGGRVQVGSREGTQPELEFRMRGFALHWPLSVARDENWFVVRAIDFSRIEDNQTPGWDSNLFVIYSLDGSKRRLYTSEKFGPEEAITGFALTPDDKTLVVATSRRLLIYDVKATPAH